MTTEVAALRRLLRDRGFRRLFTTRLLSQGSDGIFQASLASAVFFNPEHTTDAAQAAAGFAVLLLPYSLVGPFAGVLLDRWRRQRILVLANVVRCGLVLAVAALLVLAGPGGAAFFGTALAAVSVNRFYLAGLSAALPHVVDADRLVLANSLSTTSGFVAALVGGGMGLGIRGLLGSGTTADAVIAVAAAGGYLVAAAAPRGFAAGALGPDAAGARLAARQQAAAVWRGLLAGGRHVRDRPRAAYALLAIGAHRFFYGLSTVATLLLYRNYFTDSGWLRAGITGLGQVLVSGGAGVVLAAAVTPAVTRRIGKPAWISTVFAAASLVEVVFGLPYTQATLLVAAFFLGFAAQAAKICVDTILQETVAEDFRGRVFSFYDTLFNLTFVSAAVVGAALLPATGKSYPVLAGIALGYALTSAGYTLAVRGGAAAPEPAAAGTPAG